jgi:hypothetical protein
MRASNLYQKSGEIARAQAPLPDFGEIIATWIRCFRHKVEHFFARGNPPIGRTAIPRRNNDSNQGFVRKIGRKRDGGAISIMNGALRCHWDRGTQVFFAIGRGLPPASSRPRFEPPARHLLQQSLSG